jgi:carboxypeptidase family protein
MVSRVRGVATLIAVTLGVFACGGPDAPTNTTTTTSVSTVSTSQSTTSTSTTSVPGATTFTVSGTVTDGTSGGILPNIVIRITDGVNSGKTANTGSAGTYSIPGVVPGTMTLSASATGYVTATKSVSVSADTRVDWVLARVVTTTTTSISTTTTSVSTTTSASYGSGGGTNNSLDLSLFFTIAGGALRPSLVVTPKATYTVTGTFTANPNSRTGTIQGTLSGSPADGAFDGTLFINFTSCRASRHYGGTVTTASLSWGVIAELTLCPSDNWPFGSVNAAKK